MDAPRFNLALEEYFTSICIGFYFFQSSWNDSVNIRFQFEQIASIKIYSYLRGVARSAVTFTASSTERY